MAESNLVVVYPGRDYGETLVGCYKPTGRVHDLGGTAELSYIAAAGAFVAVVAVTNSTGNPVDPPPLDAVTISVVDLRTGHLERRVAAGPTRVFVSDTGSVAYLDGTAERPTLVLIDRSGSRAVDSGPIKESSVHFARGRLVWRNAGKVRSIRTTG